MAAYNIPAAKRAAHSKTLAAGVADAVSFETDPRTVEILTDGAAALFVTVDGSVPAVNGDNCYILPAFPCVRVIAHGGDQPVRLISAGTPTYSVTAG